MDSSNNYKWFGIYYFYSLNEFLKFFKLNRIGCHTKYIWSKVFNFIKKIIS